jgi:hypothetical protein
MTPVKTRALTFILFLTTTGLLLAEVIRPEIGQSLLDATVCRGPSGEFCLTATEIGDSRTDREQHRFCDNRGVRVWKSTDLKSWGVDPGACGGGQ